MTLYRGPSTPAKRSRPQSAISHGAFSSCSSDDRRFRSDQLFKGVDTEVVGIREIWERQNALSPTSSAGSCSPGGQTYLSRAASAPGLNGAAWKGEPPHARWWLPESDGWQSAARGVFEVFTGLAVLRAEPTPRFMGIGALQSGTRFYGTPHLVNGSTWLKIHTKGVSPPLLSEETLQGALDTTLDPSIAMDELGHRLHRQSGRAPLMYSPELTQADTLWVEYNKQYIRRLRDVRREKGHPSFSTLGTAGVRVTRQ